MDDSEFYSGFYSELFQVESTASVEPPPFIHLCDAADGMGEAHVTRRVAGETLGRKIVSDPRFDSVRPRLARQCGEQLANIHATPSPTALQTLSRAVLLHGDFRNGNLIVSAQNGIASVLDWELAHLGDPAEDLAWLCVNSWRFGVSHKPVSGFGDYEELLAGYRDAGGEQVSLERIRYWQAVAALLGHSGDYQSGDYRSLTDELCERLRSGDMSTATPELLSILREDTLAKLAIDQPAYRHEDST